MIVESLYLLMGKKKWKSSHTNLPFMKSKIWWWKKRPQLLLHFFRRYYSCSFTKFIQKKKILSDFFFLLSFSPPKKLILLRSPSPFKNKTSKNEFNQNKLQLSRVGRAILLWTKKQLGDVDIELLIAAFPSFYRQYVIENPNSSLWWSSHTDDLPAFGF